MALFNSERDKMMAVAIVAVLGLGYVYFQYVFSPRQEQLATMEQHVQTLNTQNQMVKAELARGNVDELLAQARQFQQNLTLMRQLVPLGNEVPALLEQVSTAARRVGLDISRVEPQPVIVGNEFDTYRYQLSIVGGYHQVAQFLTNVGALTRIIAPVKLELTELANRQAAETRARKDRAVLDAKFEIQTYVAKTGPATATAAGATAGAP